MSLALYSFDSPTITGFSVVEPGLLGGNSSNQSNETLSIPLPVVNVNETLIDENVTLPVANVTKESTINNTITNVTNVSLPVVNGTVPIVNDSLNESVNETINTTGPSANLSANITSVPPSVTIKNRYNSVIGYVEITNETDGGFTLDIHSQTKQRGIGLAFAKVESHITISGLQSADVEAYVDSYFSEQPLNGEITTDVVYVENVSMANATIRLAKTGNVNAIMRCTDFDTGFFRCNEWEQTDLDFIDHGDTIEFVVESFSGYGGAEIAIINVQSYPIVGGTWEVRFNTTGTANLTISAVNGTTWSNTEENEDLQFLQLQCGEGIVNHTWVSETVFVENYNCSFDSSEVSKVLTSGSHHLMFTFGQSVGFAHNFAFNDTVDTDFNNGTHNKTFYNYSISAVQLNISQGFTSGNFTSRIFDANIFGRWENISWVSSALGELQNNQENETSESFASRLFDMSGNVVLFHFNSDSDFGETASVSYDFSGNQNNASLFGVTLTSTSKFESAYLFDGINDYIEINDSDSIDGVENFTIHFWMQLQSYPKTKSRMISKSGVNATNHIRGLDTADVTFQGQATSDRSGRDVDAADLNGDGIDDLLIGAYEINSPGEAYIIYGPLNQTGVYSLNTPNVTFHGINFDEAGTSVAAADFNNDGFVDVLMGAPQGEGAGGTSFNEGETYIYYGPFNGSANLFMSNANVTFFGIDAGDISGTAAAAGDFNNDGIDDVIIGAPNAEGAGGSPGNAGETYIIYGPFNGSAVIDLDTANVTFFGINSDWSGEGVGAGDFNNDGIDDVIIGAPRGEGAGGTSNDQGETYVLYGPFNGSAVISLETANITFFGISVDDFSGRGVGSGDFNNDGITDAIIGGAEAEGTGGTFSAEGETYVYFGPFNGSAVLGLADANITFYGIDGFDYSGTGVGSGDFNGDGFTDVFIGAPDAEDTGTPSTIGETYVLYGPFQSLEDYGVAVDNNGSIIFSLSGESGLKSKSKIGLFEYVSVGLVINQSTDIQIYINGQFDSNKSFDHGLKQNSYPLTIGSFTEGISAHFNGTIDEFAIWNRTLSNEEMLNLYARGGTKLNLSIRTCDDSNCVGDSFFDVFPDVSPITIEPDNNQYFQYRFTFETGNFNISPFLYNVTLEYFEGTYPNLTVLSPLLNSVFNSSNLVEIAANVSDETGVNNVVANLTFPNLTTIEIPLSNDTLFSKYNSSYLTSALLGLYTVTFFAYDVTGNINSSGTTNFTVQDPEFPSVANLNPANDVFLGTGIQSFNASVLDNGEISTVIILFSNYSSPFNETATNKSGLWNVDVDLLRITSGVHNATIYANDTGDNVNNTELITFNIDRENPSVDAILPATDSFFNKTDQIEIATNVTDDLFLSNIFANITLPNATVKQLTLSNSTGFFNKYNTSYEIELNGFHEILISAFDVAGNTNSTERVFFYVDYNFTFIFLNGKVEYSHLSGIFNNTFFNGSKNAIELNSTSTRGNYTSEIFDVGSYSQWKNISWVSHAISELPNNQENESSELFASNLINMSGNVLLYHLNNDATFGENSTVAYDFSGNGNNGTIVNATSTTGGKFASGLSLSGVESYIQVADATNLDNNGNLTIHMWVDVGSYPQEKSRLLSKSGINTSYLEYSLSNSDLLFYGQEVGDQSGSSIEIADFNADGAIDIAIGASQGGPSSLGEVYITYGPFNSSAEIDLDLANVTFFGRDSGDLLGAITSGDFNADGFSDIVLGSQFAEGTGGTSDNEGETYIFYGPLNNSANLNVSQANITFFGIDADDASGNDLDTADFNADGFDDLFIGAIGASINTGEAYIVYGPFNNSALIDLNLANVTFIGRTFGDDAGSGVGSGDFNNDGFVDAIIGAIDAEGAGNSPNGAGEVYVIYGPFNSSDTVYLSSRTNITFFGMESFDSAGSSVGSIDLNYDGIDDVLIGAQFAEGAGGTSDAEGESYVLYGPFNGSAEINLSNSNLTLYGITNDDFSGTAVDAGDINDDGLNDLIISARDAQTASGAPAQGGETYVIYGPLQLLEDYDITLESNGSLTFTVSNESIISTSTIQENNFTALTFLFDSSNNLSLYVNGVLETKRNIPVNVKPNDFSLFIGSLLGEGQFFNGTIDEIAIWNRSLSEEEIISLYNRDRLGLNLSMRTCDDSNCVGEFFFDILEGTAPQSLSIENSQYVQYQFSFETTNINYTPALYNVSIYYSEGYPPNVTTLIPTNGSVYNLLQSIEIAANVTDNVEISDVFVNVTLPNGSVERIVLSNGTNHPTKFNVSYNIFSLSGLYDVRYIANDTNNNFNSTENSQFTAIDTIVPNVTTLLPTTGQIYNVVTQIEISVNVTDNHILETVNANITLPNGSLFTVSLNNGTTHKDRFNASFDKTDVSGFYFVVVFSNDTSGNVNSTVATNFSVDNTLAPNVTNILPANSTLFNSSEVIEIASNVSDNIDVSKVFANITLSNSSVFLFELVNQGDTSKFNMSYNLTNAGLYTIQIIANDTANNINNSEEINFNADRNFTYFDNKTNQITFGFQDGTLQNTTFDGSYDAITLSDDSTSGNYTSQIFDLNAPVSWNYITWINSSQTYLEIDERIQDNLTGNILLMHFNNETEKGEDANTFFDFSYNNNNGTCTDCPIFTPQTQFKNSFAFDGFNSSIIVNNSDLLNRTNELTLSAWVKYDKNGSMPIISKGSNYYLGLKFNGTQHLVFTTVNSSNLYYEEHIIDDTLSRANLASHVYPIDFDKDGDMDVVTAARDADDFAWYENTGNNVDFTFRSIDSSSTTADGARTIYPVDFDNDGDNDVVVAAGGSNARDYAWYENDGSNTSFVRHQIDGAIWTWFAYPVDVDQNGFMDIVAGSFAGAGDRFSWYDNDGSNTTFTQRDIDTSLDGAVYILPTFFDSDSDIDFVASIQGDDEHAWYDNTGTDTSFTQRTINGSASSARFNYPVDFDLDGDVDLLTTATDGGSLYLNDGSNTSFDRYDINTSAYRDVAFPVDFDSDGDLDVLMVGTDIAWYKNNGSNLNFTYHLINDSTVNTASFAYPTDFDGDGDVDVVAADSTDDDFVWYETLSDSIVSPTSLEIGGFIHVAVTVNDTTTTLYVNGIPTISTNSTTLIESPHDLLIGSSPKWIEDNALIDDALPNPHHYRSFDGIIDEVAIWNRSLLADEILNLYDRRSFSLNLSTRACDDNSCTGEEFVELGSLSPQQLWVNNTQHIQYRFVFETYNSSYSPQLVNVSIFYLDDVIPPSVNTLLPSNGSFYNTTNVVEISANVTDNYFVETTAANISLPNGSIVRLTLTNGTSYATKFNNSYTLPELIGLYSVQFIVNDTARNENVTQITQFIVNDVVPPRVTALTPSLSSLVNQYGELEISANVSDNISVDSVFVNVTLPNGTIQQVTLLNSTFSNKFNGSFSSTDVLGDYNITYIANDTSGNINSTGFTNFTVIADTTFPSVTGILPSSGALYDNNDTVDLFINATDNVIVQSVRADLVYPNGSNISFFLRQNIADQYNVSIDVNTVGYYGVRFAVNDSAANVNYTESTNFTVEDITQIYSCGTLDEAGSYALSNHTPNTSANCMLIETSHVHLDCRGYNISYGSNGAGIKVSSTLAIRNVSIENCGFTLLETFGSGYGIQFINTRFSTIYNNTFFVTGGEGDVGIYLSDRSHSNNVSFNSLDINDGGNGNVKGILIEESNATLIVANNITVNGHVDNWGISIELSHHTNITHNNITADGFGGSGFLGNRGTVITSSSYNLIAFNTIDTDGVYDENVGIYLTNSTHTNISSNVIDTDDGSSSYGMQLGSNSTHNIIEQNQITVETDDVDGIVVLGSSHNIFRNNYVNSTGYEWNSQLSLAESLINLTIINLTTARNGVSISFLAFNGTKLKSIHQDNIAGDNDSYYKTSFNKSFEVDLNETGNSWLSINISYTDAEIPNEGRGEETLRLWQYENVTWKERGFYNGNEYGVKTSSNVVFANITSAGIFNVFIDTNNTLTNCVEIDKAGDYFASSILNGLKQNNTCFNITSGNVHVDCRGSVIEYGQFDSGIGFNVSSGINNISIESCTLIKNGTNASNNYGVLLLNVTNATIFNTTIITNGSSRNFGIFIKEGSNNIINESTIHSFGNYTDNNGILIESSSNNIILSTIITTSSSSTNNSGLKIIDNSNSNYIESVYIETSSNNSQGIEIIDSSHTLVNNATLLVFNTTSFEIYTHSNKNTVENNTFKNVTLLRNDLGLSSIIYNGTSIKSILPFESPAIVPTSYVSQNKYLNISNTTPGSFVIINITYEEEDFRFVNNEQLISVWRYNISNWTNQSFYTSYYGVDVDSNVVYANISNFSTFGVFGISDYIELLYCQEISSPSLYSLSRNITSTTTCFSITTSNVLLDCQGYAIQYATNNSGYGINISSANGITNVTIQNCTIEGGTGGSENNYGVYASYTNNSHFENNIITTNNSNSSAYYLYHSNFNYLSHGRLITRKGYSDTLHLVDSSSNRIFDTTSYTEDPTSFEWIVSYENELSSNNTVLNLTTITNNVSIGFLSFNGTSVKAISQEMVVFPDPAFSRDIGYFFNFSNTTHNSWLDLNITYDVDDAISVNVNESSLGIWQYNSTLNWTNTSFYNNKYGINETTNIVYANITQFSRFGVFGLSMNFLRSCDVLNISDNYYLTKNVTTGDTCFRIEKGNTSLDCQGFSITHSTAGNANAHGIEIRVPISNITLKHCIIIRGHEDGLGNDGISVTNLNNSIIFNNTITRNASAVETGYSGSSGLEMSYSSNNNISSNTILAYGAWSEAIISSGVNNTFYANNIYSEESYGIWLVGETNSLFEFNNITGETGIRISNDGYDTFRSNMITASLFGLDIESGGSIFYDNIINVTTPDYFLNTPGADIALQADNVTGYNFTFVRHNQSMNMSLSFFGGSSSIRVLNSSEANTTKSITNPQGTVPLNVFINISGYNWWNSLGNIKFNVSYTQSQLLDSSALESDLKFWHINSSRAWDDDSFTDTYVDVETNTVHANISVYGGTFGIFGSEVNYIDSPSNITNPGRYGLYQPLTVDGTAFDINQSGVHIFGNGQQVNYGNDTGGHAVVVSSVTNVTVSGFNLLQNNSNARGAYAFLMDNVSDSTFEENTAVLNSTGSHVFVLNGSSQNTFENNDLQTFGNESHGFLFENSDGNQFASTIINATHSTSFDIYLQVVNDTVLNNSARNITLGRNGLVVDLIMHNGTKLKAILPSERPNTTLYDKTNLAKFLNISNTSHGSWILLNISYTDAELTALNLDEDTLRLWKFNSTGNWTDAVFTTSYGVSSANNVVYANISVYSPFTIFGDELPEFAGDPAGGAGGGGGGGGAAAAVAEENEDGGDAPIQQVNTGGVRAPTAQELELIRRNFITDVQSEAGTDDERLVLQPERDVLVTITNKWDKAIHDIDVSLIASAENTLPIYPTKVVNSGFGALEITRKHVNEDLITAALLESIRIDRLEPGESIGGRLKIQLPLTAEDEINVDIVYSTFGQEIKREEVTIEVVEKVAVSTLYTNDDNTFDLYALISNLPEQTSFIENDFTPTGAAVLDNVNIPINSDEITLEMNFKKAASNSYNPSLAITGLLEAFTSGPKTGESELFGPYPLDEDERVLIAQQFRYDELFVDIYNVTFTFRKGREIIASQEHVLDLRTPVKRTPFTIQTFVADMTHVLVSYTKEYTLFSIILIIILTGIYTFLPIRIYQHIRKDENKHFFDYHKVKTESSSCIQIFVLDEFIQKMLDAKFTKNEIKSVLIEKGWEDHVNLNDYLKHYFKRRKT